MEAEAVLYFSQQVNETVDPRVLGKNRPESAALTGPGGKTSRTDWRISSYDQTASYISSSIRNYSGQTSNL